MELDDLIATGRSLRGLPTDSPQIMLWEDDATSYVEANLGQRYKELFLRALSPQVIPYGEKEARAVFERARQNGIELLESLRQREGESRTQTSNARVQLSNALKQKLEHVLDMSGGYVLDFSNASFADFVQTSIGVDPYKKYDGSKASVLRQLWADLDTESFQKLTTEMLERWSTNKRIRDANPAPGEQKLVDEITAELTKLGASTGNTPSPIDTAFLEKDFGTLNLGRLDIPLSHREVVEERLEEIQRCLDVEAPLAVVFLCGSTLEGLLYEVATKNARAYNQCSSAPKSRGSVKPLAEWSLDNLITCSRELKVIGEDVFKHAHDVKEFRNYIHPRQQLKEDFKPRDLTARMAHQVLIAALADLSSHTRLLVES